MQDKSKDRIVAIGFIIILILTFLVNIMAKDKQISKTERRELTQLPKVTSKNIINGETFKEFEEYAMDQFVGRDILRSIKSYFSMNVFKQRDNNKLFIKDNVIYKIEYPLNVNNVQESAEKINNVYNKYLQGMNVYYAIIPDKNCFLDDNKYLKMDYRELENIMKQNIRNAQYINILDKLSIEDYYRTDTHWKQENLREVVNTIEKNMNLKDTENITYNIEELGDFYGVYYGQLGIKIKPDTIKILTNDVLENCRVYNLEKKSESKVYDKEKWKRSSDKYDIYLSGATPIITIENSNSKSSKELLLFRDSYGSSIAPLLVENYSKITLIDIRYISSKLLENYIDFNEQDVLFLYSTLVLNQNILK